MTDLTDTDLRTVFENYLAAFATPSRAEQERRLRASAVEEVEYTNSGVTGRGIHHLLAHIDGFQRLFPGGHFRLNWLRQ